MNTKRRSLILIVTVLILALALGACGLARQAEMAQVKPTIPTTPTAPVAQSAGPLTILASGWDVTVLEYQGAGVRCIIASDGAGVDMVCQTAPTTPAQPTPTDQPKHQAPNGSSEA